MTNKADRPDWASGPEWEGWEWDCYGGLVEMKRQRGIHPWVIDNIGNLRIGIFHNVVCFPFPSPHAALRVANAIAAELGGWGE